MGHNSLLLNSMSVYKSRSFTCYTVTAVRRRLREAGLIAKKIVKIPALNQQHINGRLHFARKYKEWGWPVVDWASVTVS